MVEESINTLNYIGFILYYIKTFTSPTDKVDAVNDQEMGAG